MKKFTQTRSVWARNALLTILGMAVTFLSAFGPAAPEAYAAMETRAASRVDPASADPGLSDPKELEVFLDSLITEQLSEEHIAGATVSVVKDGSLFFAKGYGYADVEAQLPVDPETTLFRVGSITKLFTWTAVMQLVEQGQLDLNTDINQYLDFTIPATFPEPITLKHLMTHTPGFEDTAYGFAATTPEAMVPIEVWLTDNIPARAWPPGQVAAYSNYGVSLAGYIVERVSGMPYDDYVEQHILAPLNMTHSTPRQPLPAALKADLSRGYKYLDETFQTQGFAYLKPAPAGSLSASATDMAHFMIAHLQQGRYCELDCVDSEIHILGESTVQQMHSRLWAADEHLNGMAHGFMEFNQNGHRIIGHIGDIPSFHTLLALLPEQNVGLFISYNSEESRGLREPLLEAFMDEYYPAPAAEPPAVSLDSVEDADRFAGLYQPIRYAYSKGGKILSMFGSFPVKAGSDGGLIIDVGDGPQQYVEVAPLYFEAVEGDRRLAFREDAAGNIAFMFAGSEPYMSYRKVAWYEAQNFNLLLLAVCAVLFLLVLVVEPLRLLVGGVRRRRQLPQPMQARLARGVMAALALLALGMIFGLYWQIVENGAAIPMGERGVLSVLGGISILIVALAGGTVTLAFQAWRRRWWGIIGRLYYSLIALASIAFVWFLAFWNQIGWQWW